MAPGRFDLAKLGFFLFGLPRNAFGSIDVTRDCNLRCRHCYFFESPQPRRSLTDREWIAWLDTLRQASRSRREHPFLQCTWVGGEPLLRAPLLARARRYFRYNTIVTNGTLPLPDWPDVSWYVSIDGDEEVHEHLRGRRGIYRSARQHVAERRARRVTIACCLTRENAHCVETLVRDWSPLAAYFTFDFYTPLEGVDDPLWIPWPERDRVVERLLALQRAHPGRFRVPTRALRLMASDRAPQVTRDCAFPRKAFAYDALGRRKEKCVMGAQADCARCGCVVPFYLRAISDRGLIVRDLAARAVHRLGLAG